MRIEISRWHFGFERREQLAELHRLLGRTRVPLDPQGMNTGLNLRDGRHVVPLRRLWSPTLARRFTKGTRAARLTGLKTAAVTPLRSARDLTS
jgi:hypothetical protein